MRLIIEFHEVKLLLIYETYYQGFLIGQSALAFAVGHNPKA
jgi:hypothetical protein